MDELGDYHTRKVRKRKTNIIIWNLKYDTNDLIYKTETDPQTQRTRRLVPAKREGLEGGSTGSLGLADANYYYI